MSDAHRLDFDPIERAGEIWSRHIGDPTSMRLATSIMRVQQLISAELDAVLKPLGITFARYEVLVLLSFSATGRLPLSKIGERLMVHPTSVTNAMDRLESQGLVRRVADEKDRRRTFAELTDEGQQVLAKATTAITAIDFAVPGMTTEQQDQAYDLLRHLRSAAGDFA
ncbi:MarR family winged helix-turn-helix transcriptional regulator [Aeromicrobium fastidiosum]|uniref:MarR family transcriptional regulator n=1 Tax=Aeromicrobium fastidiosum TaxID=52699 RepID=A0A641APK6_9ACTN|nr:MarR family transcriptional regulator [Aeromicrobium fastidiosum]KAA1380036.1 MarR family transcriptional regulator [Aeromicrobium fastidiosum]MBP2389561.1 DNA-binding MarR family transcriptional regulator [Aeromicrobium fastidiosum]